MKTNYFMLSSATPFLLSLFLGFIKIRVFIEKEKRLSAGLKLEQLFLLIKKFDHGEGSRMNLTRVSLYLNNIDFDEFDESIKESFTIAMSELHTIVVPDLLEMAGILNYLNTDVRTNISKDYFPELGNSIYTSTKEVDKNVLQLLNLINNKSNYGNGNLITKRIKYSIEQIKDYLKKIELGVKNNFASNPHELIKLTIDKFDLQKNTDISFNYINESHGSHVLMPPQELGGIISNLIQNAIEKLNYEPINPKAISIKSFEEKEYFILEIIDNGSKVPDNVKEKIFNFGYSTKNSGHGFGLAYVKKTVERFGGRIIVNNLPNDLGVIFSISLLKI
jgi:signal transduction histidine kinase